MRLFFDYVIHRTHQIQAEIPTVHHVLDRSMQARKTGIKSEQQSPLQELGIQGFCAGNRFNPLTVQSVPVRGVQVAARPCPAQCLVDVHERQIQSLNQIVNSTHSSVLIEICHLATFFALARSAPEPLRGTITDWSADAVSE
ncbi:hypothetical protein [Serinicoccus sp. CNJ-927]|uniref:hypothetical protein n=1 Tax=Serinicoccus sp. CNJ-927 TaxID=1904970 RepID=UPI00117AFEBE|nr:hypothetical protein [Serinicoccus sp. CNJ-927]